MPKPALAYMDPRGASVALRQASATLKLVEGSAVSANGDWAAQRPGETHRLVSERIFAAVDPRPAVWSSYLRSQGVASLATVADFLMVVWMARLTGCPAAVAGALGAISGGAISFALNRTFAFCASSGCARRQALRYLTVWLGSLVLNCGLLALGADWLGGPIAIVKLGAAVLVGTCFNYPLHRAYVFSWHGAGRS